MSKFFLAIILLCITLFVQIFLASAGWYFDITLAALITLASVLDLGELIICDLLLILVLNWEPNPSLSLFVFACLPVAAWLFQKVAHWHGWISNLIAIAGGIVLFYAISAPLFIIYSPLRFLLDLAVAMVAGELLLTAFA